jgi:hypothetical protein
MTKRPALVVIQSDVQHLLPGAQNEYESVTFGEDEQP